MASKKAFEPAALQLQTVQLHRFKAAFKPEPVPLGPFNLIIGHNGSGKSTLLEALQWIDATLRIDARSALARYFGIHDVINVRSRVEYPYFDIRLAWSVPDDGPPLEYEVQVYEGRDGSSPLIGSEWLWRGKGRKRQRLVDTTGEANVREDRPGVRIINPKEPKFSRQISDPDRLALSRAERTGDVSTGSKTEFLLASIRDFWNRAVFLRLSTNRLAAGSPATRKSYEPLLDEEGNTLPALLTDLDADQREELVERVRRVLAGITGISVDKPRSRRDEAINYALKERMPYVGRRGLGTFEIPSWMLSEGTRRITAIFALLVHDPPPSLLCIEEVENGLDPWTVLKVIKALRDASMSGTQVVVTTHSPWLLDHVDLESIIAVERKDGETTYGRFADLEEVKQFQQNVPPGARYVNRG